MKRGYSEINNVSTLEGSHKIVLLGNGCIGKSTMFDKLVKLKNKDYKFPKKYKATDNFDFNRINITTNEGIVVIDLWDTAGQERFMAITKSYIKYTTCAFLIFDLTNRSSFINLDKWLNLIIDNTLLIYLIGNKHDQNNNVITQQEIYEYADKHNLIYYETSAKKNYNSSNTPVISNSLQSSQYTSVYNIEYIFVNLYIFNKSTNLLIGDVICK
mgnify:CR=1 FL=1